jgi:CheY-like chemotaxis protein
MQEIFEIVARQLTEFFRLEHVAVFRLGSSGFLLNLRHCSGFGEESIGGLSKLTAEQGAFKRLIDTRISQVVNDISESEEGLSFLAATEGLNSMVAVPILAGDRMWGILAAFSPQKSRFSEEDGRIASLFGGQTGQLLAFFSQYVRDNLDELLVQVLGSIELSSLRYGTKETMPVSEILNAQKRLKNRIGSYVARLERASSEATTVGEKREAEETKLPSRDELSIEEVITIQGEKNEPEKAKAESGPQLNRTTPAKVLVIDDQAMVTDLLVSVLERMNHRCEVASCGRDGVEAFEKGGFDLVITDLGMPDISGWEVSRAVKRINPNVPVVVVTGWGVTPDPDKMKDSKVDFVIHKPFQIDQLEKIIRDLLQK